MISHDYQFETFKDFYEVCGQLTYKLDGRYSVGIVTDDVGAIKEFLGIELKYSYFLISIYTSDSVLEYIAMYKSGVNVAENVSYFDIFKQLISEKRLLFESIKLVNLLYSSIGHTIGEMQETLDSLLVQYGTDHVITEKDVSSIVVLTNIMYPRQVLIAYLQMDRYRKSKFRKCINDVGNDVMLGAMVKGVTQLLKDKILFYKTGEGNWITKTLDFRNIILMYRVLVVERHRVNDCELLLELYERGLSCNAIVYGEEITLY